MINKTLVIKHFDKNATHYDKYAKVQKNTARTLMEQITCEHLLLRGDLNILEIGCGTGYLTKLLTDTFHTAKITALDISPKMIEFTRNKFINNENVSFVTSDIEEEVLTEKYDLIISNATFQWLNNIENTVLKLYNSLNPGGLVCFSTFGEKTFHEMHTSYMYAKKHLQIQDENILPGQRFHSMDFFLQMCKNTLGLNENQIMHQENIECEYFDNSRVFLDSVKKIGANNSNKDRHPKSVGLIKEMLKIYDQKFKSNGKIKATYHCMYIYLTANIDML